MRVLLYESRIEEANQRLENAINKISIDRKNFKRHLKILFFGSFFIFFALVLLAIYYKLLNGSFLASPYSYGDNEFSSFHIRNFKLVEVLFSTWHGLLFYHPFYLISILLLLTIFFKKLFLKDNLKNPLNMAGVRLIENRAIFNRCLNGRNLINSR